MNRRLLDQAMRHCHVLPGRPLDLARHPGDWLPQEPKSKQAKADLKDRAEELLAESRSVLRSAQELLYASDSYSLLVILQGLDAAGKDGIIEHVFSGVNPLGCQVFAFKAPSPEELDHDFLWRAARRLPERGRIGLFNRSYYEEVLVVRVHPAFLEKQRLPRRGNGGRIWTERFESIRDFERHLTRNGTVVRKFFLNVSFEEQRKRLLERVEDPTKFWKFNADDVAERAYRKDYMAAFTAALRQTSTREAPWYVIPADRKWFARTLVAHIITRTIQSLRLAWPTPGPGDLEGLAAAKKLLAKKD